LQSIVFSLIIEKYNKKKRAKESNKFIAKENSCFF